MHRFRPGERVLLRNEDGTKELTRIVELLVFNQEPHYIVSTRGNFPIPEYALEPVVDGLFDDIDVEPDALIECKFDLGDIVKARGYGEQNFRIISRLIMIEESIEDDIAFEVSYLVAPVGHTPDPWNTLEMYEEDLELVRRGLKKDVPEFHTPTPEEFIARRGGTIASTPKQGGPKHREEEKRKLAALKKNREMIERAKAEIDDYLALYAEFGGEKYRRKIERLTRFIQRVPSRAYEIE
ncbi:hypothetical protein H1164_03970 [Thermoactinomyces daqus]|uniref:Uncharacterized protein n=1 Tax=Thermoactinomyces daqus TaxID=1329516 RepID=A0A7W1X8I3_9BACL|nr:hypothetical protein [Thermoactinomyces daqus]MBA4542058.1 hypothetical protein [Thermoactinomyces daqus]